MWPWEEAKKETFFGAQAWQGYIDDSVQIVNDQCKSGSVGDRAEWFPCPVYRLRGSLAMHGNLPTGSLESTTLKQGRVYTAELLW